MKRERMPLQTLKVTKEALRFLRLISAWKGERQYQVIERLLREEYERLRRKEQ